MKKYQVTVNGTIYEVEVEQIGEVASQTAGAPKAAPIPAAAPVISEPATPKAAATSAPAPATSSQSGSSNIESPMPGTILKVNVQAGSSAKKGDILFILEAMKMENEIVAPDDITIASVTVSQGASVSTGDVLATYN